MIEQMSIYSNWIIAIFTVGYLLIIFEHQIGINKATSALLMAVGCWSLQFADVSLMSETDYATLLGTLEKGGRHGTKK